MQFRKPFKRDDSKNTQETQQLKSAYDRPRQITGLMQFGVGKDRKIAPLKIHGEKPVYGVELNKDEKAKAVTRPLLNIPFTKEDGEVVQLGVVFRITSGEGKFRDPKTNEVIGTFKIKCENRPIEFKDVTFNEKGQNKFGIKNFCIRKNESGPTGGFKVVDVKKQPIGQMTGDWSYGLVDLNINGTTLSLDLDSPGRYGFKYRILFDSNDEYTHPNRTAYPTGPILIEKDGNKLMHVARVMHSMTKAGKPMMKIVFNGQARNNAFVFFKENSNDNSIVEFNEKNELVEIGKFNGNKDSQYVQFELAGKSYSYVVPIGNIMFDNTIGKRDRMPKEPNVLPFDPEKNPLTIEDLLTHYLKREKRCARDWTDIAEVSAAFKQSQIQATEAEQTPNPIRQFKSVRKFSR